LQTGDFSDVYWDLTWDRVILNFDGACSLIFNQLPGFNYGKPTNSSILLQIDGNYIGEPPPLEVTIFNLNDNIDKAFLLDKVTLK
jgi:hypothetical protein